MVGHIAPWVLIAIIGGGGEGSSQTSTSFQTEKECQAGLVFFVPTPDVVELNYREYREFNGYSRRAICLPTGIAE